PSCPTYSGRSPCAATSSTHSSSSTATTSPPARPSAGRTCTREGSRRRGCKLARMLVDLSHVITDGMTTYPGLPAPVIGTHLSREAAEEIYGPGITFHIGLLTICTNT